MKLLTDHASLFVVLAAILGFLVPPLFLFVEGVTQTCILGFIMLTMGLTLTADDFRVLTLLLVRWPNSP